MAELAAGVGYKETIFLAVRRRCLCLRYILLFVALAYIAAYFTIPATPGNSPHAHPLGWWGWFDQSQYLLSAEALAGLDLSPEKHFYPPLYPAVGAIFLKWSSGHLYFAPNLLFLLWFSFVFIRFSDRYLSRSWGVGLLLASTLLNFTLFKNYVIPWTSTLSAALLASGILGLIWLDEIKDGTRTRLSLFHVLFIATCLGLLVPTRPVDAVIGGVISLGLLVGYWKSRLVCAERVPRIGVFIIAVTAAGSFGLLLWLGFNQSVFGSPFGGYVQAAGDNGFFLTDIAEKFISIWLDGSVLYGEQNSGLTERYPWLFVSLAGLLWSLFRGDRSLRTVALATISLFVLYLPYGDLLPNGLWRYLNIHYFKWSFPFLALFAALLVKDALTSWRKREGWATPWALLIAVPLLLLSLHLAIEKKPVSISRSSDDQLISVVLPNTEVDLIDFNGLSGDFAHVYFGTHRLLLDDREINRISDYRLLPMEGGVRLLFIRPVVGHKLEFFPDRKLTWASPLNAYSGTYRVSLGGLKPFRQFSQRGVHSNYRIGEIIDFSHSGESSLYATQGWSGPEVWGRWSTNGEAAVQMHIDDPSRQSLDLELVMGAFLSESHPCQRVTILANNQVISHLSLCIGSGGQFPSPYSFKLPQDLLEDDHAINIRFITPDAVSPEKLGVSTDDRVLGVGLRSLMLTPSQR